MIDSEIKHQMLVNLDWLRNQTLQDGVYVDQTPMTPGDLTKEAHRFYHFGKERVVQIVNPKALYCRPGGTTHRVVDDKGTVYILPAPGHSDCYIKIIPRDPNNPVQF